MKPLFKGIGLVAFYTLAIGLIIYAASRSLDFIQTTLPPDQKLIGILGLLATEGGAIIWLVVFLKQASGIPQKVIAALSAMIDMLGSIGLFTMDTLLRSGENGAIQQLTQGDIKNVILSLSGLIGLNLIAVFFFHITDPDNMRKMREDAAHDAVQSSLLAQIEDNAENLAKEMLPGLYQQWQTKFKSTFSDIGSLDVGNFGKGKDEPIPVKGTPFERKQEVSVQRPLLRWPWKHKNQTAANQPQAKNPPEVPHHRLETSQKSPTAPIAEKSSSQDEPAGEDTATTPANKPPTENEQA